MGDLTLNQIVTGVGFIVMVLGFFVNVYKNIRSIEKMKENIDNALNSLDVKITNLENNFNTRIELLEKTFDDKIIEIKEYDKVDRLRQIKSALINYMSMAENYGINEEQKRNAYELYDEYIKNGGNSYVHDKFNKLVEENKI